MPDPTPPPQIWTINHGKQPNGKFHLWIGIEVDNPFAPLVQTVCTCGLGLGSTSVPLPFGANVFMAGIGLTNSITHETNFLSNFTFATDAGFTNDLNNGVPAVAPGYLGAPAGTTWQGFSGVVDPFVPPAAGANEVWKLWFGVEVDPASLLAMNGVPVVFAAGSADPTHPPVIFTIETNKIQGLSVPDSPVGVAGLLGLSLLLVVRFRQRQLNQKC